MFLYLIFDHLFCGGLNEFEDFFVDVRKGSGINAIKLFPSVVDGAKNEARI